MRYPASEKLEIIRLVEQSHLGVGSTLDKLGIPKTTFYRWYDRFLAFGDAGLEDRNSSPGRVWNRIPDDVGNVTLDIPRMIPHIRVRRYFLMAHSVLSAPHFHNEDAAFAYVERALWPDGPYCPFCGVIGDHVRKLNGKTTRKGLHKCYACRKPFTVRAGTIFESSHLPLHLWLQVIHLMCASKKGIATRQIQRMLQCSMKTAWFLTHRIREAMKDGSIDPLGGEGKAVEADETFIGGKEKNRHLSKRAKSRLGGSWGKETVFSLVERDGSVRSMHVSSVTAANLRPILVGQIDEQSKLYTDDAGQYRHMSRDFDHEVVRHKRGEYVRGDAYTNTVENYFSILKRGITGCYFHVSEAHLHRYLAEFDFRYSNREGLGVDDVARADAALKGFRGKRLTYETAHSQAIS